MHRLDIFVFGHSSCHFWHEANLRVSHLRAHCSFKRSMHSANVVPDFRTTVTAMDLNPCTFLPLRIPSVNYHIPTHTQNSETYVCTFGPSASLFGWLLCSFSKFSEQLPELPWNWLPAMGGIHGLSPRLYHLRHDRSWARWWRAQELAMRHPLWIGSKGDYPEAATWHRRTTKYHESLQRLLKPEGQVIKWGSFHQKLLYTVTVQKLLEDAWSISKSKSGSCQ